MSKQDHDDAREAFAEAVANGQVHPALAGYLASIDDKLAALVERPDPEPGDDGDRDDDGKQPDPGPDSEKAPSKATPSTVARKAR